jgi:hypothetical protein
MEFHMEERTNGIIKYNMEFHNFEIIWIPYGNTEIHWKYRNTKFNKWNHINN